jgi:nicotinamide-nucleotide amidase
VSEQAVREMAKGVRKLANTTYGIAVSGIAGPGGATSQKPVGTIWLGIAGPNMCDAHLLTLPFDRRGNKQVGAYSGLDMLRKELLATSRTAH